MAILLFMEAEKPFPKTLVDAIKYFAEPDVALNFLISLRWPNGVACPRCGSARVSFTAKRRVWTCEDCPKRRQFSVKVGTIMEDSPLSLDKWVVGIWLICSAKNGISSYELHRALGITQKSAWFMLHRIREALRAGTFEKMEGVVEADETFVGGSADFMHKKAKKARGIGRGFTSKTAVMGLLEHGEKGKSRVRATVIKNTQKSMLKREIDATVEQGTTLHTDAWIAYQSLGSAYVHKFVDHAVEYVREGVHTNGLENFWCLLKRTIRGTYVHVNAEHLSRYLDEQAYRFNERKGTDSERFLKAIPSIFGRRLTYRALTGTV